MAGQASRSYGSASSRPPRPAPEGPGHFVLGRWAGGSGQQPRRNLWAPPRHVTQVQQQPSTTVVTILHNWYLGSGLIEGGRSHATDRCLDGRTWPDPDRCDGEHHRGWPRLLGRHWEAAGPLFRSFGVPPTGSDRSARLAQFGRTQEQLASGGNLRGAHPVWLPVLVGSG